MRNIIIFVALLGAAAIFTVLYCLIAAGSQAEKKLTEIMRKEEEQNEDSETVLQWGKRKNIKKIMINGELVIE